MCAHLPKCSALASRHESGPFCSAPFLEGELAGREAAKSYGWSSREAGRTHQSIVITFFSKVELKEKRSTDMLTTSSEPRLKVSGNSQWSINGTTTSPGPWKPLVAPPSLCPSEHSAVRYSKSTQRSYIKHPMTPFLPLSLPSWSDWGFEDIDSGTYVLAFSLSWFPLLYPYRIPFPNQKGDWGEIRWLRLPPFPPQTSVCRSMISCPTSGMVVLVFSHSTECSSRGEAARGSRSLRTHAGGDCGIPRTPSHGLSIGACCLSCGSTKRCLFSTGVTHQAQSNSWFNQNEMSFITSAVIF